MRVLWQDKRKERVGYYNAGISGLVTSRSACRGMIEGGRWDFEPDLQVSGKLENEWE